MSPAHIRKRDTGSGRRYDVRYRLGGRGYKILHAGTFKTLAEARARRDLVAGELAAGRDPRVLLSQRATQQTIAAAAVEWLATRIDVEPSTRRTYADHIVRITADLGTLPTDGVTPARVRAWIAELAETLAPASVKNYVGTLRQILDHADVSPNPARDKSVRLPKTVRGIVEPPTAAQVDTILQLVPKRWRLPLRVLEQTGMRIGEVEALEWRDVDLSGSRLRVRAGKTAAARRWVKLPDWITDEIALTCPPDDRAPERLVFHGFTRGAARNAMDRACKAAGIPHFHPHDLRHRYASVQMSRGVPVTALAAQLGHTRTSLTLDTYSHVLMEEE
jgi:integrase